ncbi:unnamed protein product [Linum tenue]|uniref:F-box domain-containing protein n=1 Tax=Linum tenue TaxID=586396 RepID=A0AAV0NKV2_9ROSI|nr:unnamed protein product [Linum tenue]
MDILSNLPPDVTDHILTLLPIKEAAKTSLLSQKWRHRWRTIPHLVLDRDFAAVIPHNNEGSSSSTSSSSLEYINKVTMEINRALALHKGPITKFVLAVPGLRPSPEIDQILLRLSEKSSSCVQEFSLRFGDDQVNPFKFLDRNLAHEAVRTSLPVAGFGKLTSLELKQVVLSADFFGEFIPRKCPLLEELKLLNCDGIYHPQIVAPRLQALYFHSTFYTISFEFTPLLHLVSILENGLYHYDGYGYAEAEADAAAVFASLPALRQLTLGLEFLLLLADGVHIPTRLPTPLRDLTELEIPHLCLSSLKEARLDTGNGRSMGAEVDSLLEMLEAGELMQQPGGGSSSCLQCLEVFKIQNSLGELQAEMELVRFVLANARQLRRVHITALPELEARSVAKYLMEVGDYWRASTRVEVVYTIGTTTSPDQEAPARSMSIRV